MEWNFEDGSKFIVKKSDLRTVELMELVVKYMPYIIGGIAAIVGIIVAVIFVRKRKMKKAT